jgi:hypothetical protein
MSTGADLAGLPWGFAACLHRRRFASAPHGRGRQLRRPYCSGPPRRSKRPFSISGLLCSGNIRRRFRTRRRPSRDGGIGRHRNTCCCPDLGGPHLAPLALGIGRDPCRGLDLPRDLDAFASHNPSPGYHSPYDHRDPYRWDVFACPDRLHGYRPWAVRFASVDPAVAQCSPCLEQESFARQPAPFFLRLARMRGKGMMNRGIRRRRRERA